MATSTRALLALTLVVPALGLAACGEHRRAERSAGGRATLPRALALRLAADSDEVVRALAAHDACAARSAAIRLRRQTIDEINAGRVPAVFQEPLQSTANDLASRIRCVVVVPAAPRARPAQAAKEHGHGKHEGHGKHKGHDKGEGD